ncbi:hypothetical protein BCR33DRAFT_721678 [Rhizoclosmatium globosum]|uniref:Uncharacterized protein n=1 Tax=Rhizoclosmatium globosum TaxID=329046 RepID=A0A1Y2BSD6_9FUNG|nr:hypothetical protein BCR33DRAFT_721678 [Rhizoclosmatium globosum]|eukprot:ORY37035.1 hypothetical protein BCR33DRAFT_721678 [Rhizoclosmatium globosum]
MSSNGQPSSARQQHHATPFNIPSPGTAAYNGQPIPFQGQRMRTMPPHPSIQIEPIIIGSQNLPNQFPTNQGYLQSNQFQNTPMKWTQDQVMPEQNDTFLDNTHRGPSNAARPVPRRSPSEKGNTRSGAPRRANNEESTYVNAPSLRSLPTKYVAATLAGPPLEFSATPSQIPPRARSRSTTPNESNEQVHQQNLIQQPLQPQPQPRLEVTISSQPVIVTKGEFLIPTRSRKSSIHQRIIQNAGSTTLTPRSETPQFLNYATPEATPEPTSEYEQQSVAEFADMDPGLDFLQHAPQQPPDTVHVLEEKLRACEFELETLKKQQEATDEIRTLEQAELHSLKEQFEQLMQKQNTTTDALRSAEAKVQVVEAKNGILETDLVNKDRRLSHLTGLVKEREMNAAHSQLELRNTQATLRQLRKSRETRISDAIMVANSLIIKSKDTPHSEVHQLEIESLNFEISDLKHEIQELRTSYEDAEYRCEMQEVRHNAIIADQETRHSLEIKELKDQMDAVRTICDREKDAALKDLVKVESLLDASTKMFAKELKQAQLKHNSQMEEIRRGLANQSSDAEDLVSMVDACLKASENDTLTKDMRMETELGDFKERYKLLAEESEETKFQLETANDKITSISSYADILKDDLKSEADRFKEELTRLQEGNNVLQHQLNQSNHEFIGLLETLKNAEKIKFELEAEVEQLKANLEVVAQSSPELLKAKEKISSLENKNAKLLEIISKFSGYSGRSSRPTSPSSPSLPIIESQLSNVRYEYEEKIKAAEAEVKTLQEEVEQLRYDCNLAEIEIKTLKLQSSKVDKYETEIADLKSKLEFAAKEILELTGSNEESKWSLSLAHTALEKEKAAAGEQKTEVEELRAQISQLKEDLNNAILDLKDANEYMDELEAEIAELKSETKSPTTSLPSPSETESMAQDIKALSEEIEALKSQLASAEEECASLFDQLKESTAAYEAAMEKEQGMMATIETLHDNAEKVKFYTDRVVSLESALEKSKAATRDIEAKYLNQGLKTEYWMSEANNYAADAMLYLDDIDSYQMDLDFLENAVDQSRADIFALEAKYLQQGVRLELLEAQIATNTVQNTTPKNLVVNHEEKTDLLQQIEILNTEIATLKEGFTAKEVELNGIIANLQVGKHTVAAEVVPSAGSESVSELQDQVATLTRELETALDANDKLHDQLDDQIAELEDQDAQLSWLEDALDDSRQEIRQLEAIYLQQGVKLELIQNELAATEKHLIQGQMQLFKIASTHNSVADFKYDHSIYELISAVTTEVEALNAQKEALESNMKTLSAALESSKRDCLDLKAKLNTSDESAFQEVSSEVESVQQLNNQLLVDSELTVQASNFDSMKTKYSLTEQSNNDIHKQLEALQSENTKLIHQLQDAEETILKLKEELSQTLTKPNDDSETQRMLEKAFQQVAKLSEEKDNLMETNEQLVQKLEEINGGNQTSTPKKKTFFF